MTRAQKLLALCESNSKYSITKVENDGDKEFKVSVTMPWPMFKGPDGEAMRLTIEYSSDADGLTDPEIEGGSSDTDGSEYELTSAQETQVLKFLDKDPNFYRELHQKVNKLA